MDRTRWSGAGSIESAGCRPPFPRMMPMFLEGYGTPGICGQGSRGALPGARQAESREKSGGIGTRQQIPECLAGRREMPFRGREILGSLT
ncbi:MAG: hypothetical protein LUQ59_02320 [Methanothrix sp.]|nr:hypothetical protein [Methanothrix sp.]